MSKKTVVGLILVALALPVTAMAESLGSIEFPIPSGWTAAKQAKKVHVTSPSRDTWIEVRGPLPGSSIDDVARAIKYQPFTVLHEEWDDTIGDQPCHAVIYDRDPNIRSVAKMNDRLFVVTVMTAEGIMAYVLESNGRVYDNDVQAYIDLVNGTSFGHSGSAPAPSSPPAPAPPPPAPPPPADYNYEQQSGTYEFQMRNESSGCVATIIIDNTTYRLNGGEVKVIQLSAGAHRFRAQGSDGNAIDEAFEVPDNSSGSGACAAPRAAPVSDAGLPYYEALANKSYFFTDVGRSFSSSFNYSFKVGDASCPLIWTFFFVAIGGGNNIENQYTGCAYFVAEERMQANARPPAMQTKWKFVLHSDTGKRTVWFEDSLLIYTDAFRMWQAPKHGQKDKWTTYK